MMPLANVGVPSFFDYYGAPGVLDAPSTIVTLLLVFACVVLLETAVLARVSRQASLTALRDSFTANLVSTLAGVCLVAAGVVVRGQVDTPQFAAMFAGSILIETPVLRLFHVSSRTPLARTLVMSTEMNVASYVLMGGLLLSGLLH